MSDRLKVCLASVAKHLETVLSDIVNGAICSNEILRPERLVEAMRYASINGGKRLRPVLVVETARMLGREDEGVYLAAAALECIHCYSLIHDDLPCMDDDDLRRGRPTVHKAFDEATAVLAGDALLTIAFDVICREGVHADAAVRLRLCQELARAAGLGGMVGGQVLDLEAEKVELSEEEILRLQAMKTGALIRYACRAGAILAGASEDEIARLSRFGEHLGAAFQLADDLLDVEADTVALGKTAGKDIEAGKATLVALYGVAKAHEVLAELVRQAHEALTPEGERAGLLHDVTDYVANRKH